MSRRINKHIDDIRVGDAVVCPWDGLVRTVGPENLKRGTFMGTTLWGDCYRLGTVPVIVELPHLHPLNQQIKE